MRLTGEHAPPPEASADLTEKEWKWVCAALYAMENTQRQAHEPEKAQTCRNIRFRIYRQLREEADDRALTTAFNDWPARGEV